MNFFGSSAPTPAEVQREAAVKEQITENLRQALRALQVAHVNSELPIESEDTANAVCSVLEAVFLHGLKTPVTNKSYWGLLQKTTHKNTLSQLNRLGQITTEIGLCRAWLRLALNDGVLESYMDAILADTKTIRQYYCRTAYLRDAEHPGILKTYTQSLSSFYFQLSYNSSVLNIWSHTPLILAGLSSPQPDPKPVIAKTPVAQQPSAVSSSSEMRGSIQVEHSTNKVKHKVNKGKGTSRNISTIGYAHNGDVGEPPTPHNTPYDPSELTSTDIETIRGLTTRHRENSADTSSTNTSQISHPDPVDGRLLDSNLPELKLHAQMERQVGSAAGSNSKGAVSKSRPRDLTDLVNGSQIKVSKKEKTAGHKERSVIQNGNASLGSGTDAMKQKVTAVYDPNLNPFDRNSDSVNPFSAPDAEPSDTNPFSEEYESSLNPFENGAERGGGIVQSDDFISPIDQSSQNTTSPTSNLEPVVDVASPTQSTIKTSGNQHKLTSSSNVAKQDMQVKSKALSENQTNEVPSIYDIYQTNQDDVCNKTAPSSGVCPGRADHTEEVTASAAAAAPHQPSSHTASPSIVTATSAGTPPQNSLSESLHKSSSFPKLAVGKSPPLDPEMSTATATSDKVEVAKEALLGLGDSTADADSIIMDEGDFYSTGNSLVGKEGWSSDFETSHQSEDVRFLLSDTHRPLNQMTTSTNESFDSMVYNYSSSLGRHDAPTMTEVLDGLPDINSHTVSMATSSSSDDAPKFQRKYQPLLDILGTIGTEKGLDVQNYQCKGCSRPVGIFYGKARVCGYDACYYCYECHENEEAYIPARVVYNWDFRKQKVCRQNFQFLQQSEDDPLLNISVLNPKLYDHVQEMADVKKMRTQLRFLKAYLFSCKQLVADELRKQIWPREYYYDDIDVYSLNDLLQVATSQLQFTLSKVVKFASKHVYDCGLCSQKGFICEMCNSPKVIYPFEMDTTVRCERCKAVYHRDCKKSYKCPKCTRRQERLTRLGSSSASTPDSVSDYAVSPITQLPVV